MARVTAQEFAEKWGRRTAAATNDYEAGVRRVTEAPGQKAAAAADRYQAGVQRSLDEGKWQRRVGNVTLQEWQQKAIAKGKGRIAQGVQEAQSDVQQFAGELLGHIDNEVSRLPERGGLEENIARMTQFTRGMANFRRS